ncbi:MAG TPA: GH116 family glycosyl hydrolase [Opitutaceae bacterium]|jgi:uncharacterized protein (DUF608 family)
MPSHPIGRRDFFRTSVGAFGALAAGAGLARADDKPETVPTARAARGPDRIYRGEELEQVAFPMGGIGAGMICLGGTGALTNVSVRNHPQVQNEPGLLAAIGIRGRPEYARVLEGPVPRWKLYERAHACSGSAPLGMGLPRFKQAMFHAQFPFAHLELEDRDLPISARITGWSPFEPGDTENSCLPVAGLEYTLLNRGGEPLDAVFSFNARNFLPARMNEWDQGPEPDRSGKRIADGFVLYGGAWPEVGDEQAWFSASVDDPDAKVNLAWFRGGWFDAITMAWRDVEQAAAYEKPAPTEGKPPTGATVFVPFRLAPGQSKTIRLRLAWYSPHTTLRKLLPPVGADAKPSDFYQPWYGGRFANIEELSGYWGDHYASLKDRTERFSRCFFDSTLPPEAVEAAAANLSILKSPTVLRQADGRLWGWEGCEEDHAQGEGTCTHVWNYAQAIAHLFPSLERTLRETEFGPGQDAEGHQNFRVALPIAPSPHHSFAAADGQLGGIMKVYREWRISGDTAWLRSIWPKVRTSLEYCIRTWDPDRQGLPVEQQHNTYDIEFWGPNGMIASFYVGALQAAVAMGRALGDDVSEYEALGAKGASRSESELFNGEYYYQRVEWKGLRADPRKETRSFGGGYSPEAAALLNQEGPKYQYGTGCLSDGVLGSWLALQCGLEPVLDPKRVQSHLEAVHRHNFRADLSGHANPQRSTYANGKEAGLLLCSWPRGGMLSLPFVYSNEVWTGIEYQAASHLIALGRHRQGLDIVRGCRARYDGTARNPFDEYEWGHWYARAMASYALLGAFSGARYDAVERVLHLRPSIAGDFRCFLSTATGYGTVGVAAGRPFLQVVAGAIPYRNIHYVPAG